MTAPPTGRLQSVQALRGVAALTVAVFHLVSWTAFTAGGYPPFDAASHVAGKIGHAGVDLFFSISGAIMFTVLLRGPPDMRAPAAAAFLARRAARIYPTYWVTCVAILLVTGGGVVTLSSALLITVPSWHPVAWTMAYEVRFYVIVTLLLLMFSQRRVELAFAAWAIVEVALVICTSRGFLPANLFGSPLMLEFTFGVTAAALVQRGLVRAPAAVGALGLTCLVLVDALLVRDDSWVEANRVWAYGLPCTMILYSLMGLEAQKRLWTPRVLFWIGEASYSLYLWHYPILEHMRPLFMPPSPAHATAFLFAAIATIGITTFVSYLVIERLAIRYSRSAIRWAFGGRSLPVATDSLAPQGDPQRVQ